MPSDSDIFCPHKHLRNFSIHTSMHSDACVVTKTVHAQEVRWGFGAYHNKQLTNQWYVITGKRKEFEKCFWKPLFFLSSKTGHRRHAILLCIANKQGGGDDGQTAALSVCEQVEAGQLGLYGSGRGQDSDSVYSVLWICKPCHHVPLYWREGRA